MKRYILLLAIMASTVVGCSKINLDSLSDQELGTALAIPIGNVNITLANIYKQFDTIITPQVDDNNTVFIYWEKPFKVDEFDLKVLTKGEKFEGSLSFLDDATLEELIKGLPDGQRIPLPQGYYQLKDTVRYSFNFNEQSQERIYFIDSVLFRNTTLNLELDLTDIELDENTYLEAEIHFPNLASDKAMKFQATATTGHTELQRNTGEFIAGFERTGTNEVDMYVTFKIVSDGTKTISKNSAVDYSVEFNDINFEIVHGYIYNKAPVCSNHTVIALPDIDQLYKFMETNLVALYNPQLSISLTTNLGVDASIRVNQAYATTRSGKVTHAVFDNDNTWFEEPIATPKVPYDTANYNLTLDRDFGKLNELFREIPDSFIIDWDVYMGQTEHISYSNFIVDPIQLDAKFSIRVPIWFDKGTYVNFNDTIPADLTAINNEWANYIDIDKFDIFLNIENTLPVHANAILTFLDENDNVISTKEDLVIPCPRVDEYGRSIETATDEMTLEFVGQDIANIVKTKKIAIEFLTTGYDEESTINFHATDGIKVKVSAYANVKTSISNFKK